MAKEITFTAVRRNMAQKQKHKVKITIVATISSDEYDNPETMMEELTSEADYNISSTDCVEVIETEWMDSELI